MMTTKEYIEYISGEIRKLKECADEIDAQIKRLEGRRGKIQDECGHERVVSLDYYFSLCLDCGAEVRREKVDKKVDDRPGSKKDPFI